MDDEYLIRELLKGTVPWAREGFEVRAEAATAEEALRVIENARFDLVIADICMPVMDGIRMAEHLLELSPGTPVIILSGHDTTEYARRSVRAGVWDYLLKPIVPDELCAALRRVDRRLSALEASRGPEPRSPEQGSLVSAGRSWGVLDEVRAWLHERVHDPELSLRRAAKEFLLNPSYLSRRFKQAYGSSFTEYLAELRIKRAMELARTSGLGVAGIAREVGLPDSHYFSITFRKRTGRSLTQYRRELLDGSTQS